MSCGGCRNLGVHKQSCRFTTPVVLGRCSKVHVKNGRRTKKHAYATRQDAMYALEFIVYQKQAQRLQASESNTYQCDHCDHWHLTSKEVK